MHFQLDRTIIDWLLGGDPAVVWQVKRDLLGRAERTWTAARRQVPRTGWGRRLLAAQNPDGHWGRGAYRPKWTCTTYTLQLLRRLGLPPQHRAARRACRVLLDEGLNAKDGGINFWRPRRTISETCVTGMVLSQLCYFGVAHTRIEPLLDYLLREQMPDGGWNCRRPEGATHSSFHTTINVLEGLREHVEAGGARAGDALAAEARGRAFLLDHRLYRSSTTGAVVSPQMTRFAFPPRWHHDVLRALDYFRAAGVSRHEALIDALELVARRRRPDGRWTLPSPYRGDVFFPLEQPGQPSRINTLRALRVLQHFTA